MTAHMNHEIQKLKDKLLGLCSLVEKRLWQAVNSIRTRDGVIADEIMEGDIEIDNMEVDIEEECLKILALYQPVAIDLRFIVTALKINNDLERIGDLTVNIAERAKFLAKHKGIEIPTDLKIMADKTKDMLNKSLEALISMDCGLAYEVCLADDEVDMINRKMYAIAKEAILTQPDLVDGVIHLLSASRDLERIADHATNIAEDVIYMVEGRIVRHQTEDYE